ncbi:LOW QUALITY PROTEIN: uncharacterized protein LOC121015955, partial [Herpailurus yagouaroundi]|uniref:LOW QUALITY PROTEIN: uncharacterized protein LOC121015955 n=1 Tax=Herpailurus yagouaroundi TaxID=1608482 RepID=UPI001AD6511D
GAGPPSAAQDPGAASGFLGYRGWDSSASPAQPSEASSPTAGEETFLPLDKAADELLKWSLQALAEPKSRSEGWGYTYLLGETARSPTSFLEGRRRARGPSRTQRSKPLAAPGWGTLVDHGVPGAAPQVGPRCSQLYPLPMAFVFLILCLLLFFNTKRKKKRLCAMKFGDWVRGALGGGVWPRFQGGGGEGERPPAFLHTLSSCVCPGREMKGNLSLGFERVPARTGAPRGGRPTQPANTRRRPGLRGQGTGSHVPIHGRTGRQGVGERRGGELTLRLRSRGGGGGAGGTNLGTGVTGDPRQHSVSEISHALTPARS